MSIIREFKPSDKEQVIKLWINICINEYGFEEWRKDLEAVSGFENMIVAEEEGQIVGTIAYKHYNNETAEIKRLYVNKDSRGLGTANELLITIIEKIQKKGYTKLYLETWKQFESARRFYEKNGFVIRDIQDELIYHYTRDV